MTKLLTDNELARLEEAQTEQDWSTTCDAIKATRGGSYPADWYAKVILSGLARRVAERWGDDDRIRIMPISRIEPDEIF